MTGTELANELGLSASTVSRIRKENGLNPKLFKPNSDEFIAKYEELKSSRKMATYYNVDKATILNFSYKIGYRNKYADERLLNEEEIKYVVKNYQTMTSNQLADQFNCSTSRIKQIWLKAGNYGKEKRSYYCNFDYFAEIDKPDKAYFLGFIAADGCVYSRNKQNTQKWLQIAIHRKDKEILEQFKHYIEGDNPIRDFDVLGENMVHPYSVITIVSDKICNDLSQYNIVERKTWTYIPSNIPEKYMFHYLRGFFDGDGSISCLKSSKQNISNYVVNFCGNKATMQFIYNKLKEYNINSYLVRDKRDKYSDEFYGVSLHKAIDTYNFLHIIYKDSEYMRLSRKHKLAEDFINLFNTKYLNTNKIRS